jgi:hypothetical protein
VRTSETRRYGWRTSETAAVVDFTTFRSSGTYRRTLATLAALSSTAIGTPTGARVSRCLIEIKAGLHTAQLVVLLLQWDNDGGDDDQSHHQKCHADQHDLP